MKLADLQGAYRAYLLSGDSAPLAPAIVEDAFDAGERLAIYRNNFLISLTEALKANFPVTRQLLGEDFFAEAAQRFVRAHPPRQPCLFEYGADFSAYLSALPQLGSMLWVAEVARFEFARIAAYNAPREVYLTAPQLATLSPDRLDGLPIGLARHVVVFESEAPVLALWTAHQAPEPNLAGIDLTPRPRTLLICRPHLSLTVVELEPATLRFLDAAQRATQRTTLGQASAALGDDGAVLARVIAQVLELHLLVTR